MIKKICYLALLSFYLVFFDSELNSMEFCKNENFYCNSGIMSDRCSEYINFINRIGSGEDVVGDKAPILFENELKKNFNGHLVAENRDVFVADLLSVYTNYGSWKLVPLELIAVPEHNTVILRINIEAQNFGRNTAIVILHFDSNYLIKEIIEVFSPIQDSYQFRDSK
jgi:hypothetical protein